MERPDSDLLDMQQPTLLLKHGRWGEPHFRKFQLSPDLSVLSWNSTKKRSSGEGGQILLQQMSNLELGLHSDIFKRKKKQIDIMHAFSVYYSKDGSQQTLDLVAPDDDNFQAWTNGLRWLIRNKGDSAALDVSRRPLVADVTRQTASASIASGHEGAAGADMDADGAADNAGNAAMAAQMRSNMQAHQDIYTFGFGGWGQLGLEEHPFEDADEPQRLQIDAELDVNVRGVACGFDHTVICATDGKVYAWGHGGVGRLGTASSQTARTLEHVASPTRLAALGSVKVTGVSCGHFHSLFLTDQHEVWATGANDCGQLGLGHTRDVVQPQRLEAFASVGKLAAAAAASAAVTTAGGLWTWGCNESGELGHGDREPRLAPAEVAATAGAWTVTDVHCGDAHMMATALAVSASESEAGMGMEGSERALLTWGAGGSGQLGHGGFDDALVPTAVATMRGKEVRSASCGAAHSAVIVKLAHMDIGQLFVWGAALPVTGAPPPVDADDPSEHNVAIPRWVDLSQDQTSGAPASVVAVACCANNTVVLSDESTLVAWGAALNEAGEPAMRRKVIDLGDKDVVTLSAGGRHVAATVSRKWITDQEASACMRCKGQFTFINRRHHCRNCGGIFCKACSNNFAPLLRLGYTQAVRHCDTCFARVRRGE